MEFKSNKIIRNFISKDESNELISWINTIDHKANSTIHHITEVRQKLNGNSYMFDISNTNLSNYISSYQSGNDILNIPIPEIIHILINRISNKLNISSSDVFMQVIDMNKGGVIKPHYDSCIDGFINYKCNISVLSNTYNFYVDKTVMSINKNDLYCFEASLYKHWSDEFNYKRILLSFGFILPYKELGRSEDDVRVRLSRRIKKYIQK